MRLSLLLCSRNLVPKFTNTETFIGRPQNKLATQGVASMTNQDDNALQKILLESPKGIAELLKSAAHPARIQILTLLLQGEHEFAKLMQHTKLSKTALANHLKLLMKKGLLSKASRGEYRLTDDGKELLSAAATVYKESSHREEKRREQLSRRYTKRLIEEKPLNKKIITKKAEYQHCWLSYTGAMAGSLKALGEDCNIVDIGGYSGYAFIINVSKGQTCPSGPTALKTWKQIIKGTESLGWSIEHYEYPTSYPAKEGEPTPEEIEIVRKLFERIKREIDERDRPVVLWGLVVPEYGIVNGYEGNSYLTSTFRRLSNPGKDEDPIPFHDLKAPGCIDAFFFRDRVKLDPPSIDKAALERALNFATANMPILKNYAAGPPALDEWANVLENLPEKEQNYMGNSYVGACVAEGRWIAAEFLKRITKKFAGEQMKNLGKAAKAYEEGAQLMERFTKIFPFQFHGEMKLDDRVEGARILREVKPLEEKGISHMKKAVKSLKTS